MRKSPLQNRVLATGDIVAVPERGRFMGNRGILHDDTQTLGKGRWKHKAWIICELVWKDWHRTVMSPRAYTELFFWDEAVALAAGHRPCALCRRKAYNAYRDAADLTGPAKDMDDRLHDERAIPRKFLQRREVMDADQLPDGAIVLDDQPKLILGDQSFAVSPAGYAAPAPRPTGSVIVLTPKTSLNALSGGYRPVIALDH